MLPEVGDVIKSGKFAYGYKRTDDDAVTIDGKTTSYPVTKYRSQEWMLEEAARTGKIPPKTVEADYGCYDETRADAEFVVEDARMTGGGTAHGPHDVYPDGWHITARRLSSGGEYDPDGELICFYMTGCFTCMVSENEVEIVRKLERVWRAS